MLILLIKAIFIRRKWCWFGLKKYAKHINRKPVTIQKLQPMAPEPFLTVLESQSMALILVVERVLSKRQFPLSGKELQA